MKYFIKFFSFLGIVYAITSCKHDPIAPIIPPAPAKVNWALHPATVGKQFVTNGLYAEPNRLSVVGFDYHLYLDSTHQAIQQGTFPRKLYEIDNLKPAINKDFFAYVQTHAASDYWYNAVKVRSTAHPTVFSHIPIQRFGRYTMIFQNREPTCLLTEDNKLLIPVADTTGGMTGYILKFQLTMGTDSVEYRLEERIQLHNPNLPRTWATGGMLQTGTEEVWANLMATCYRINMRNKVITPFFSLSDGKFAMIRDTLFAVGFDKNNYNLSYNYLPKGQTQWQQFKITDISSWYMQWYFVENEILVVYHNRYLYHFTVQGNKVQLEPLDSEGIEMMTDITYFKGRVYIASSQGLYYKSWKDFWTYTP